MITSNEIRRELEPLYFLPNQRNFSLDTFMNNMEKGKFIIKDAF